MVVAVAINTYGGETRAVQVPDVRGEVSAEAIAQLQNAGFTVRTQNEPNSEVAPDHVISTSPEANTEADAGEEITLNVSTGPEQREVPDVKSLTYAEAVRTLTDAGFGRFRQQASPSTPELKDRVMATNPPANQTSAITNEVTIIIGSGPRLAPFPRSSARPSNRPSRSSPRRVSATRCPPRLTAPNRPVRCSAPARPPVRTCRWTP